MPAFAPVAESARYFAGISSEALTQLRAATEQPGDIVIENHADRTVEIRRRGVTMLHAAETNPDEWMVVIN